MFRYYPYPPPGYQKKALPDVSVPVKVVSLERKKNKEKEKEKEKKVKDLEKEKEKKLKDLEKEKEKEKKVKDLEKEKEKEKKVKDLEKEKEKKVKDLEKEKEKKLKDALHKEKKESTGDKGKEIDKEKHKERRDKDKKEKRKKDGELTGISHDKYPGSSKLQRTSQVINVLHSNEENGRVCEITLSGPVACPLDRDSRNAANPTGSVIGPASHSSSMYIKKEQQPNGKVDPTLPPLVLSKPLGGSSLDVEATPSSRPSNHNHLTDSNNLGSQRPQKLPDFSICDTLLQHASWSTLDDEDWLCPSSEQLHTKPMAKVDEGTSQQVWTEVVYLSSLDMYALPYVVPY